MSSILRRLLSHKIARRKFSTAAVNRELLEPSSPWLMLPPSFIAGGGEMTYNFYSPIKGKVVSFNNRGGQRETDLMRDEHTRLVGSSHGWLALHNSRTCDLFLSNPLSGRRVDLPPFGEGGLWPSCKVIISSSPYDQDCRALMILGPWAAYCLPGLSTEWAPLGRWDDLGPITIDTFNDLRLYTDFVYSPARKMFLGFSYSGRSLRQEIEGWDITDPVRPRTVWLDRFGMFDRSLGVSHLDTCLVSGEHPDQDQLFVVRRNSYNQDVKVHRIKDGGELELCSSLDDLVMFIGINHSLAVKASRFPQLKPNSIYFSDARNLFDCQSIGMIDFQNNTWSSVYYPYSHQKDPIPQPWFTPTLD